ncbi:hypothetical protein G8759_15640 [Spirosoma aureum]|uniref:Uncharacterized protein n=1 Tax=Spirosoma aureum TaxID=2692134 RepID=A0A6G9AN68_9BACT|nr:hypothetical protein [Spirosoma aureum]QIP13942.1 hypothetical protein G8759_15640 [Spirosoma aureum]
MKLGISRMSEGFWATNENNTSSNVCMVTLHSQVDVSSKQHHGAPLHSETRQLMWKQIEHPRTQIGDCG